MKMEIIADSGWVQISLGAAQVQIIGAEYPKLGLIHTDGSPTSATAPEFEVTSSNIEYSLGGSPCYIKALTNKPMVVSVQDIS